MRRLPAWRQARLACLILLFGASTSVAGGLIWRAQAQSKLARALNLEATSAEGALSTAIKRMDDLVVIGRALVNEAPRLTNTTFARWFEEIGGRERYRGVEGFGYVSFVAPDQLDAFRAALRADPLPGLAARGPTQSALGAVSGGGVKRRAVGALSGGGGAGPASGMGASACLLRLLVPGPLNALMLPGLDLCKIAGFDAITRARDTGQIVSFMLGGQIIAVFAPVYQGGLTPGTLAARRALAAGVIAEMFDARDVLDSALAGRRELAISISRWELVPSAAARQGVAAHFASGFGAITNVITAGHVSNPALRARYTIDADGAWAVDVDVSAAATGLHPDRQGLFVLFAGLLLSLLGAGLVQTLANGRSRALRMVTERTEQLRHQALHDALTGLPNRTLLMERADALLREISADRWVAAIYIDIDGFKGVNDSLGHGAGDRLLRAAAGRISGLLRASDLVGRIGGDEFVVIAEGAFAELTPETLAERLRGAFTEPFALVDGSSTPLRVTASLGLAVGPRSTAEELLRDADIALYQAKEQGRNRAVAFRRNMHVALQQRVSLENELRGALARDEMQLVYQPILDLYAGRVVGVEALMRWQPAGRELVFPAQFIPLAEESDLIVELGSWALREACTRCAAWHRSGHPAYVSVNVAARQLQDPGFVETVLAALSSSGLAAEHLTLEITETAIMRDSEAAAGRLEAVVDLGARVAIDDFGTGYSSLAYLHRFDVDALKIDRTFVSDIGVSSEAESLIGTLIALADSLGIETVAEGIETEDQREFLVARGCGVGQGYLFSRPVGAERLRELLPEGPAAPVV